MSQFIILITGIIFFNISALADMSIIVKVGVCRAKWECPNSASGILEVKEKGIQEANLCYAKLISKIANSGYCATPILEESSKQFSVTEETRIALTCPDGQGAALCADLKDASYWTGFTCTGSGCNEVIYNLYQVSPPKLANWVSQIKTADYEISPEIGSLSHSLARKYCGIEWSNLTIPTYNIVVSGTRASLSALYEIQSRGGVKVPYTCNYQ